MSRYAFNDHIVATYFKFCIFIVHFTEILVASAYTDMSLSWSQWSYRNAIEYVTKEI